MNGFGYLRISLFFGGMLLLIDGALIMRPNNTEARIGERVVLQCSTDRPKALFWQHATRDRSIMFYKGEHGFEVDKERALRLSVSVRSNGRYDLVIDDVQQSDEGNYTCSDDTEDSTTVALIVSDTTLIVDDTGPTDGMANGSKLAISIFSVVVAFLVISNLIMIICLRKTTLHRYWDTCRKLHIRDPKRDEEHRRLLTNKVIVDGTSKFVDMNDLWSRLQKARDMLVDRLDIGHGLLDMLVENNIISKDDKRHVEHKNRKLQARRFLDFPEYDWERLRSEQQAIKCNRKLMMCLEQKCCAKISGFLQCLIDNNQEHLVNFITNPDANSEMDGEMAWPLNFKTKNILIVRHNRLEAAISGTIAGVEGFTIFQTLFANKCISQNLHDEIGKINQIEDNSVKRMKLSKELLELLKISSKQAYKLVKEHFSGLIGELLKEDVADLQHTYPIDYGSWVEGVVSLGSNIYACCWRFGEVYLFRLDGERRTFEIKGMKYPWDMIGYEIEDSENQTVEILLISDNQWDDGCLRIVEHPNDNDRRKVGRIEVDGIPDKMSLISIDGFHCVALLVRKKVTCGQFKWRLEIIKTSDISVEHTKLTVHKSIPLSCYDINHPWHVVQLKDKNLIVLHEANSSKHEQHDFLITELSVLPGNEIDIIQSIDPFYPNQQGSIRKQNLWPQHMAIDEKDRIYISDYGNELVVTVDYQTEVKNWKIFLDYSVNPIFGPIRLHYLEGQNQLIVAQVGQISVFQTEAYPTPGNTYESFVMRRTAQRPI